MKNVYCAKKYSLLHHVVLTLHLSGNIQYNLHEGQWVDSDERVKIRNQHPNRQSENTELAGFTCGRVTEILLSHLCSKSLRKLS